MTLISPFETYRAWKKHNSSNKLIDFVAFLESNDYKIIELKHCKVCNMLTYNTNFKNEPLCTDCMH